MDIRDGGITGKASKYSKVGISPLDLDMQQTCRPVARQLFSLARLLLRKVFSLTRVVIHYASCSMSEAKPSKLSEQSLPHLTFYTFQEAQRNLGGFWSLRVTHLLREYWKKCLKTAYVQSSIRDHMKRLGSEGGPSLSRLLIP